MTSKGTLSTIHKEDPSTPQKMEVFSPLQKKTAFGKPRIFNSITGLAAELPFKVPENTHWKSMSVVESQDTSNQAFIARRSAGPIWFWFLWGETKTQQKLTSKRQTAGFFRLMKTPLHVETRKQFWVPGIGKLIFEDLSKTAALTPPLALWVSSTSCAKLQSKLKTVTVSWKSHHHILTIFDIRRFSQLFFS